MGEDPSTIRQDIEQTRAEMGDTVEALGYKTDVKTRAKNAISDKVGAAREKVGGATPDSGEVKHRARRVKGIAEENPLGLAIGAAAVGFVGGLLVPSTQVEDEKIGPAADQVKEKAKETGQEALERGKQVAQQAAEAAREAGQEQADELRSSAQQKVSEAQDEARGEVGTGALRSPGN
jgi:gas vesicle protein